MVLDEPLLGPAPESLQAVDVDLAGREVLAVVHFQVPVAAEHEAVIAPELVRVNDTSPADLLNGELQKGCRRDIGYDINMNQTVPLQNAKYRDFAGGTPTSVSLSSSAEVRLVQFDLPVEQGLSILGMAQNGQPHGRNSSVDGSIRNVQLQGHLPNGNFQFKELDEG